MDGVDGVAFETDSVDLIVVVDDAVVVAVAVGVAVGVAGNSFETMEMNLNDLMDLIDLLIRYLQND